MYSCEKDSSDVVDPEITFPNITGVLVTPGTFDTTFINPVLVAVISSEEPVANVNGRVKDALGVILGDALLKDDGVLPDTTAGDGRFTGQFSQQLSCKLIGNYQVEFVAQNVSGVYGNTVIGNFSVVNNTNNPPLISDLILPDSLKRPSGIGADTVNIGFMQVRAFDPEGLCNIDILSYNSFRPTGNQNGFNVPLFDDGNILAHGDSVANDGKFSLLIKITPSPADSLIGYFRFEFKAKDRGSLESNTLIDSINVYR